MDKLTTHILLLRHGQTDANASGVLQGHQPTPLNRLGVRQAMLLGDRVAAFRPPVGLLVSSDLTRAMQTAGPIASACGLDVVTDPAWRERGFGLLEGKFVGDKERWRAASGEMDPPGAEPTTEMQERVRSALLKLVESRHAFRSFRPGRRARRAEQRPPATIAVVTHGGPIRGILRMLDEGRLPRTRGPRGDSVPTIVNGSILHLLARHYRDGVRWRIVAVNDAVHLDGLATRTDAG